MSVKAGVKGRRHDDRHPVVTLAESGAGRASLFKPPVRVVAMRSR